MFRDPLDFILGMIMLTVVAMFVLGGVVFYQEVFVWGSPDRVSTLTLPVRYADRYTTTTMMSTGKTTVPITNYRCRLEAEYEGQRVEVGGVPYRVCETLREVTVLRKVWNETPERGSSRVRYEFVR